MTKVLRFIAGFNACLIFILVGLYYMAANNPFRPGDLLYGIQNLAENELIGLTGAPLSRTEMHFDLVKRRLANISIAENPQRLELALAAFDRSLTAAIRSIQSVPPEEMGTLYRKVDSLLAQADIVLNGLGQKITTKSLAQLEEKIQSLKAAATVEEMQKVVKVKSHLPSEVIAKVIPFLGSEFNHADFPMTGGHEDLDCQECHQDGIYKGTPSKCIDCHSLERELADTIKTTYAAYLPVENHNDEHYSDACQDCHTVDDWTTTDFNHQKVRRCNTCHIGDMPLEEDSELPRIFRNIAWREKTELVKFESHYPGDCADCHSDTERWEEFEFDHNRSTCKGCHGDVIFLVGLGVNPPCQRIQSCDTCHTVEVGDHDVGYAGSCTDCHNDVNNWLNVYMDHSAYPNCFNCHLGDKPAAHYSGSCATCHSTETWDWGFAHNTGSNCKACHTAPEAHSTEQCSTCHTMNSWAENVSHHSSSDCARCHTGPTEHYTSGCSDCHNSDSWKDVALDHNRVTSCSQCHPAPTGHYSGECSNCHSSSDWTPVQFDHTGLTLCVSCHSTPFNHYSGACVDCHSTSNWLVSTDFLHTIANNCASCHEAPTDHYTGDCTACHANNNWGVNLDFLHAVYTDCEGCHAPPYGHWPGACADCHSTSTWEEYAFDHTNYTDCKACHDRPSGHVRGQCSKCHSTTSWTDVATPTEPPTQQTPDPLQTPDPSETVTVDLAAEPSETPTPAEVPDPSDHEDLVETLDPSETPVPPEAIEPSDTPDPSDTPAALETPVPSDTPAAPETPDPSDTPVPSDTPDLSVTPVASETPDPSVTPVTTETQDPSATPEPEVTPEPFVPTVPAVTPDATTPTPSSNPTPPEPVEPPPPINTPETAEIQETPAPPDPPEPEETTAP